MLATEDYSERAINLWSKTIKGIVAKDKAINHKRYQNLGRKYFLEGTCERIASNLCFGKTWSWIITAIVKWNPRCTTMIILSFLYISKKFLLSELKIYVFTISEKNATSASFHFASSWLFIAWETRPALRSGKSFKIDFRSTDFKR